MGSCKDITSIIESSVLEAQEYGHGSNVWGCNPDVSDGSFLNALQISLLAQRVLNAIPTHVYDDTEFSIAHCAILISSTFL